MTTTTGPLLAAANLYRFYHAGGDETLALRGVSIDAHAGEMVAVTGPSGSGKSTLMACLAGLDEPDGGTVDVSGERMTRRSEAERAELRARTIGMLYQDRNLVEHLTVRDNVVLAQVIAGARDDERVADLLDLLGIGPRGRALPATLSGGELARAGLAVALANHPPVVLADEPTGELDADSAGAVIRLLRHHTGQGGCVVLVTHNHRLAAAADREIHLQDGVVQ